MKTLGFSLLAMAAALAVSPRAIGAPVIGSSVAGGADVARLSTMEMPSANNSMFRASASEGALSLLPVQVTWNGYSYSDLGSTELSEVIGKSGSVAPSPARSGLAGAAVNEGSAATDPGQKKTSHRPGIHSVGSSVIGPQQPASPGSPGSTPEPSSLILLGTGLLGLAFILFRKAKLSAMTLQK